MGWLVSSFMRLAVGFAPGPARRYGVSRWRPVNRIAVAAALLCLVGIVEPASATQPIRILAFGDSLTAGYGLAPEDVFPVKLQARLRADGFDAVVLNGGFSGDTTAGGLSRVKWSLKDKPQYAIVELGANDALRGIAPAVTEANLDKILARFRDAHVKVLLAGMRAPANWGVRYQKTFDAIYPHLAAKYGVPLYPFFLDGVALNPTLNQIDGLHPTARGVDVIVDHIAPAVEKLIGPRKAGG
jgi:acyl-CoA thioesterase-1